MVTMCNVPPRRAVVFPLMLALIAGFLIPLALPHPAKAAAAELDWVDAGGPGNGDAMALVSDNVHGILYRATVGAAGNTEFGKGVWKYQAGTWTSLGGEVASLGIRTLAYDSAGDRLYAGSNGQGIWCYNPSDGTWSETNIFMRAYDITALAFGGGKLYAGVWDPSATPGNQGRGVWYYDPTDPSGAYTETGGGVATWRILSLAWDGERLYAGPEDRVSGWPMGVWYYDPASPSLGWIDTGGGMYHRRATALAYDSTNDLLYSSAGFTGVYYYDPASTEDDMWTFTAGSTTTFEVTSLAWGEGKLYAGCNDSMSADYKGVWCYDPASTDGDKWTDTGGGLNAYQMKSLAFDTYHHHLFAGTTQDGVWRYNLANSPPTWSDTRGGVSTSYVDCLAYDSTSRLLYVGTDNDGVWRFDPATDTWTDIGGGVSAFETICLAFGGGKLYAGCYDHNAPAYKGVWCYDPASPAADKWTDTGGTAKAIRNLVYDDGRGLLYAGTGEKYTDSGGQGVWCYDPASSAPDKWSDISSGDIDAYKIDSLALGGDRLYAGCYDIFDWWKGVWQYDPTNPSAGWTSTGDDVSTFEISSLAWGGDKLYAGCWDWNQPLADVGEGVWCYDPTIPAPDKWSSTGGSMSPNLTYALAWDGDKLYTSCVKWFTARFDGVWGYDPASPDADKWWDTGGGVGSYYVSSLLYDAGYHRLYAGTGGEGVWYYGAPPVIAALDPASSEVGSEVTVHGSCFGPGGSGSEYVTFGTVPAVVKPGTWTDNRVVCYVPPGVSGTVPVTVYNLNGASNRVDFTVALPPPPPQTTTFYFAEGYTGAGFQEYLCLGQPAEAPLDVTVTYLFKDGSTKEETYNVPGNSRFTVNVNAVVGEGKEVSLKCDAEFPFIAERPMYFDYSGGGSSWTGGHDVMGATRASTTWYFAEGYTGEGFDEWVCVLNPGDMPADLTFRFQTQEEGEKVVAGFTVPAHSRGSFKANDLLGGGSYQTSLALESTQPVVAERPMYFSYSGTGGWGWTGGSCVMGVPSLSNSYYFAEGTTRAGFEEWLTLQNPGTSPITVNATYLLASGDPVPKSYTIDPAKRSTVYVPREVGLDQDVSVYLSSDSPFLAERPMYFSYQGMGAWGWTGGHCVIGANRQATEWFFAEGYTGQGFEEWLCIQNPGGAPANVTITYYPEGGGVPIVKPQPPIPPNSRYTVPVNADAGAGLAISAKVSSDQPVIVERPMYFNYNGTWSGGHDVVGYTP